MVNNVKFDGISTTGRLIETKGSYDNFVDKNGNFRSWFRGAEDLVAQARRQINAAQGAPIDWYFSHEKTMNATMQLFKENSIKGINFIYAPPK